MPNHITNHIEITGDAQAVANFKQSCKVTYDQDMAGTFDFNGVAPMPEELQNTVAPLKVVATQAEADKGNSEKVNSVFYEEDKLYYITKEEEQRRLAKYGATNWYDWSWKNWGTKWNAYEVHVDADEPTRLALEFQTAWSPPVPIFEAIQALGLTVRVVWYDEDPSNYGEWGDDPYTVFSMCHDISVEYTGGAL